MKQRDVIRRGGFEAVPHLPALICVIWGMNKAVAGSFARSAVSLGQRGGVGRQAGAQAAAAPPPPGAAEGPLMPAPGRGGSRLGRGLRWGRGGCLLRGGNGGGGRGDEALPHPAPPRGGGGHGAAGPNPGQEGGARPSRLPQLLPQLLLPLPTPEPRPRASSYSASKRRRRPERGQLRSCVMPPCVLWSRPRRQESWAAPAARPRPPPRLPQLFLGLRQFLLLWQLVLYLTQKPVSSLPSLSASTSPSLLVSALTCALF